MVETLKGGRIRTEALYLDAVDEAIRRARRPGRPKGPAAPRRQVNDIAIRQLKDVERQRKAVSRRIAGGEGKACETCKHPAPLDVVELAELVKASSNLSIQIVRLSQSIRLGHEAERKAFEGLTEEQLMAVFRAQLPRLATGLDDDEKRLLLEVWFGGDVTDVLLKDRAA